MRNLLTFGLCLACLSSTTAKLRADDAFRKEILEVLKEAEEASRKIKDNNHRFILQRLIATTYGKTGYRKQARELFTEFIGNEKSNLMKEFVHNRVEATILSSMVKSGNAIAARQIVLRLVKDEKERKKLMSKIVSFACESNQIDEAIEITKSLPVQIQELKYWSIAVAFAKQGKIEQAYEFLERIKDRDTRTYANYDFATQLVYKEKFRQASKVVENLPAKIHPDQTTELKTLVVAFLEKDRFDYARKLISKFSDSNDGNQAESFEEIASTFAKKKNYSEALEITSKIRDHWYRFETLTDIASAQIEHGKLKNAKQTIQLMNSNYKLIPVEQRYDSTVSTYVSLLSKIGDYKLAMNRIAENEECDKPYLRSNVVEICANREGMNRATKLLKFIKDEETKWETKKWLIVNKAERSGVASVKHLTDKIKKTELSQFYHNHFARLEAEKGNSNEVWKHFEQMQDIVDKFEICEKLIEFQIRKKDSEGARKSLEKTMAVIFQAEIYDLFFPGWFRTTHLVVMGFAPISNFNRLLQMAEWYAKVGDIKSAEKSFLYCRQTKKWRSGLNTKNEAFTKDDYWYYAKDIKHITWTESRTLGRSFAIKHARQHKHPLVRTQAFLGITEGLIDLQQEKKQRKK